MHERQPATDGTELLHRISRLSSEAPWTTDELRDALREGGVDPARLVGRVLIEVRQLLKAPSDDQSAHEAGGVETPRPLLGALQAQTHLPPSAIAQALEVSVPFLSAVSRYPKAVPASWRQELATRAERALQVDRRLVLQSLARPFQYAMAASRDTPYAAAAVRGYEDILDRSSMSPEAQQCWRALAQETSP